MEASSEKVKSEGLSLVLETNPDVHQIKLHHLGKGTSSAVKVRL